MRVEAAAGSGTDGSGAEIRILLRKCLLGTSGPGRPRELFLTKGTYLAGLACRSGRMS
jgi:hypothetical protein